MKTLKPIYNNPREWEALEQRIQRLLKQHLYQPLLKSLQVKVTLKNTTEDILESIKEGHIRYQDNGFVGVFSAKTSMELKKLGAVWSKRNFKWLIRLELLPESVKSTIHESDMKDTAAKEKITANLDILEDKNITDNFSAMDLFEKIVGRTDTDFRKSVRSLTLAPKLSKHEKRRISKEYSENLKLYIRKWTNERILRLRKEVNEMTFKGERYSELAKKIQSDYQVSSRKARFLARQETNLLVSKLKQVRYASVGIDEYLWVSVQGTEEHPVRPLHKKLTAESQRGITFSFSRPPKSGTKGERQNPGEPFGCRCIAIPVVKFTNLSK